MNVDIINKQYIFNVNIDSNGNQTVNADIVSKQLIVSVDVFKGGKGDKGDKGEDGIDGADGQDGQDLTLSDFSVAPEAETLNDADKFLIEQGGVWKSITKENLSNYFSNEIIVSYSGYMVIFEGITYTTLNTNNGINDILNYSGRYLGWFDSTCGIYATFHKSFKKVRFSYEFACNSGYVSGLMLDCVLYKASSVNGQVNLVNKVELLNVSIPILGSNIVTKGQIDIDIDCESGENVYIFFRHNKTGTIYFRQNNFSLIGIK